MGADWSGIVKETGTSNVLRANMKNRRIWIFGIAEFHIVPWEISVDVEEVSTEVKGESYPVAIAR